MITFLVNDNGGIKRVLDDETIPDKTFGAEIKIPSNILSVDVLSGSVSPSFAEEYTLFIGSTWPSPYNPKEDTIIIEDEEMRKKHPYFITCNEKNRCVSKKLFFLEITKNRILCEKLQGKLDETLKVISETLAAEILSDKQKS